MDLLSEETLQRISRSLGVMAAAKSSTAISDWPTLARLVKTGGAKSVLSVGDLIEEKWIDTTASNKEYSLPWGVRHFGQVELADGSTTNGMYLETQYTTVKGVQFSHQRAFLKCPDGLSAGTYYFTFAEDCGTHVKKGDIVCFTLAQDVPAGGRIAGCFGATDQPKERWRIYPYDASAKVLLETVVPTFEAVGTDLGVMYMKRRNGNLNSCEEMAYGWNRWSTSALRQYLNSAKGIGEWWTPQDEWDIAPEQWNTTAGFLSGLPQELIDAMLPVKTRTYLNIVSDVTEYGVDYEDTYDKVFVASLSQANFKPQREDEGDPWDYWRLMAVGGTQFLTGIAYPKTIRYQTDSRTIPRDIPFRSAQVNYSCSTWGTYATGKTNGTPSTPSSRPCPCCVIGKP